MLIHTGCLKQTVMIFTPMAERQEFKNPERKNNVVIQLRSMNEPVISNAIRQE